MDLIDRTEPPLAHTLRQYYELTKPRIVMLAAFCAVIGMFLAADGMVPWEILVFGTLGISLLAGAGFTFNCMVERGIDARMARTRARPAARGEVSVPGALAFAGVLGGAGAWLLLEFVNPLTMWLTLATFVGYAVVYTVVLKPATPQNIVIGGASGAMPPLLGWAAVANDVGAQALVLFLIIFVWTPPHFWALAIARRDEYARAGIPMLPVTHGIPYTRLQVLLYTVLLVLVTFMPFLTGMSGLIYLAATLVLNAIFLYYAFAMQFTDRAELPMKIFKFSIQYLMWLFAALLLDHYVPTTQFLVPFGVG
jgi:protoheme IX farnesyltransferase